MGDEIAGSNALAGAVDGWISAHKVERRPNGNRRLFLRIEGRGGVGSEIITEMDHTTLHFSLIPSEECEADTASARKGVFLARRQERHALACQAMQAHGEPCSIAELAAAMELTYKVAWALVREMVALGSMEEALDPQHGRRCTPPLYRLSGSKTPSLS